METKSIIALWPLPGNSQQPTINHIIPHEHTLFALPERQRHTCLFHINRDCTHHIDAIPQLYLHTSFFYYIVISVHPLVSHTQGCILDPEPCVQIASFSVIC